MNKLISTVRVASLGFLGFDPIDVGCMNTREASSFLAISVQAALPCEV